MAPGAKRFIEHAIFTARICVNPHLARHTNTTEQDIEVLKATLKHIFALSTSASRPGGSINVLHVWWRDHENSLGSFNENDFFKSLTPVRKGAQEPSNSLDDYEFPTPGENVYDLA